MYVYVKTFKKEVHGRYARLTVLLTELLKELQIVLIHSPVQKKLQHNPNGALPQTIADRQCLSP